MYSGYSPMVPSCLRPSNLPEFVCELAIHHNGVVSPYSITAYLVRLLPSDGTRDPGTAYFTAFPIGGADPRSHQKCHSATTITQRTTPELYVRLCSETPSLVRFS